MKEVLGRTLRYHPCWVWSEGFSNIKRKGVETRQRKETGSPTQQQLRWKLSYYQKRSQDHSQRLPQLITHIHRMKCNVLLPQPCAPFPFLHQRPGSLGAESKDIPTLALLPHQPLGKRYERGFAGLEPAPILSGLSLALSIIAGHPPGRTWSGYS